MLPQLQDEGIRSLGIGRGTDDEAEEGGKARDQQQSVGEPEEAIVQHVPGQGDGHKHERKLAPQNLRLHAQRNDERANARHQADVGDIGPHRVADRDAWVATQGRRRADGKFGRGSPDADDGEPDHQRRHAEILRRDRRPQHETIRAPHQ